jgi:large subunit ribosomal protein L13
MKNKPQEQQEWILIDATDQVLGRLASRIATSLMEKDTAQFEKNRDTKKRHIVVINVAKLAIDPRKAVSKLYRRHSWYLGGLKEATLGEMMKKDPRRVLEFAVAGMLPKNSMQRDRMNRLYVFADDKHPHEAQLTTKKA